MKTIFVSMFSLVALLCVGDGTLESQLMEKKNTPSAKSNPETRKIYEAGIVAVRESGVVEKAVQVGQKVPDFTLKNAKGEAVMLSELLKAGPVVLTWYRGGWCPYCNITLAAMQKVLPEIKEAGAQLVALTPELPDKSLSTREKNGLTFEVLTDLNHGVAKAYGVAFELTPEVAAKYQEHFDLLEFNGKEAGDNVLPLAATYVIDQAGVVRWGFLDADYRKRAEPAEVVAFLKGGMKGK
jgi:peroxiredoxin